ARGRQGARALHRFRWQVGRPEGEARLHGARREPRVSVRPRVGRAALTLVPVRRDRRGFRSRLGRVHALRSRSLQETQPPAPDRDAAAEDSRHRTVRLECRLRAQRGWTQFAVAQPEHRGVPRRAGGAQAHQGLMSWTTPEAIVAEVEKRWRRGEILAARMTGEPLFPLVLKLKRPNAREIAERFGDVLDWARALQAASREARGFGFDLERREVTSRVHGTNALPVAAVVPSETDALRLIRETAAAERFRIVTDATLARFPELRGWLARRSLTALEHAAHWPAVLAVLEWFVAHPRPGLY